MQCMNESYSVILICIQLTVSLHSCIYLSNHDHLSDIVLTWQDSAQKLTWNIHQNQLTHHIYSMGTTAGVWVLKYGWVPMLGLKKPRVPVWVQIH